MKTTRVVIVGGGFGGVKAALELAGKKGFEVQLISDSTHFEYHGALYRSAVGHSPKEVVIPLKEIFEGKKVEVILDRIEKIDSKKKLVVGEGGDIYKYDGVILGLGSQVNYFGIPGLEEHTETMHDISSTLRLRKKLVDLFSEPQRRPVRIAVVGGGASGVELASELPHFAELIAKRNSLPKPKVTILLVEASPRLLPNLSPKVSEIISKRLVEMGVEIYQNISVESCANCSLKLSAGGLDANLIVWTAGAKPADFFANNPEVFTLARNHRVVVNEHLQARGHKDIYVLGDNADTKYSGMAQTAIFDAKFIASNLVAQKQKRKIKKYKPRAPTYVITGGGKWAVVQQGKKITSGTRGWGIRRQADLWVFKNFIPYKQAIKTWRSGNKFSKNIYRKLDAHKHKRKI
jgi:NADH dehydrogenase